MSKDMTEIYKDIDSGIHKNKAEYMKYAKLKNYLYFSECIHTEYQTRSATSIIKEMEDNDIIPIGLNYLRGVKNKVDNRRAGRAALKYEKMDLDPRYSKIELKQKDGYCYQCRTKTVKRKIALGNHALCAVCDSSKKSVKADLGYHRANGYSFNY